MHVAMPVHVTIPACSRPHHCAPLCSPPAVVATAALLVRPDSIGAVWAVSAAYGLAISGMFAAGFSLCETFVPVNGAAATAFIVGSSLGKMSLPILVTAGYSATPIAFPALIFGYAVCASLAAASIVICGRRTAAHRMVINVAARTSTAA